MYSFLPPLELTSEYKIGHKVWHRFSNDEGQIVGVSEFPGQWEVKWRQANQIIPTPEFMLRGWRPERLNAIQIED